MERRLAAILVIDMVGYSRLMAADESGTIDRQKRHRETVVDPQIALILLAAALVTLFAPALWHHLDSANNVRRQRDYGAFAAEFLDSVQGLATLKAFGGSRERAAMLQAVVPMYIMPFMDTSRPYKDFIHSPLVEELTELERKELEAIMVNRIVGPGGQLAITVDEELTELVKK